MRHIILACALAGILSVPAKADETRQNPPSQFNYIQPLVRRPLDGSVVQIEAINVHMNAHLQPGPRYSKGHSEEWPLSRQHAAGG